MKSIIFDTGPIISLAINNLLNILPALKKQFNGEFYITSGVERELVNKPLSTKAYEFEALRVLKLIRERTLKVVSSNKINNLANHLLNLANNSFMAHNHPIKLVHLAEMEALATAILLNSNTLAIDERTTRMLIEEPKNVERIFRNKLHTEIRIDNNNLGRFKEYTKNVKVIRSVEIVTIAFKLGLLDKYLYKSNKKQLLDGLLWGMKLNGCAVSKKEIEKIKKLEVKA
ncbi:hypothetical protein HQ529_00095 [Candidatus Woesearchaeota archaeon]|nr:hypothetical protein [Candidatus Woesearchaeota archaeon]